MKYHFIEQGDDYPSEIFFDTEVEAWEHIKSYLGSIGYTDGFLTTALQWYKVIPIKHKKWTEYL